MCLNWIVEGFVQLGFIVRKNKKRIIMEWVANQLVLWSVPLK